MYAKIQKWGNSHAVRIPKNLLALTDLKENDEVDIKSNKGNIIIVPVKKHKKLEERIMEYKSNYKSSEWDTGDSEGKEVF